MLKEHEAELTDMRERALEIAEQMERERRPREYPGQFHVSEPPAKLPGSFQTHVRMMPPKPGEFDPTPQQDMAAALRKLAAAVDQYLEAIKAGSAP